MKFTLTDEQRRCVEHVHGNTYAAHFGYVNLNTPRNIGVGSGRFRVFVDQRASHRQVSTHSFGHFLRQRTQGRPGLPI